MSATQSTKSQEEQPEWRASPRNGSYDLIGWDVCRPQTRSRQCPKTTWGSHQDPANAK